MRSEEEIRKSLKETKEYIDAVNFETSIMSIGFGKALTWVLNEK